MKLNRSLMVDPVVLSVLSAGPLHGYALWTGIETRSPGLVPQSGPLYVRLAARSDAGHLTRHTERVGKLLQVRCEITPGGYRHLKLLEEHLRAFQRQFTPARVAPSSLVLL